MFTARTKGDLSDLESAAYQLVGCGISTMPLWAYKDAFAFVRMRAISKGVGGVGVCGRFGAGWRGGSDEGAPKRDL